MINYDKDAIEYIAKIADGGMRDAITLMDKCLSYSSELTMDSVLKALGVADYSTMFELNQAFLNKDNPKKCSIVSEVYNSGVDLKLFIKNYFEFMLDLNVYSLTADLSATKIPVTWFETVKSYTNEDYISFSKLLNHLMLLQSEIKWEQNPKALIIARFILFDKED